MASLDWTIISTITSTVALAMGGFLWIVTKVFNLGKTSQRLDTIESDLAALKHDTPNQINALGQRLDERIDKLSERMDQRIDTLSERIDQRIDKLITIAESNKR